MHTSFVNALALAKTVLHYFNCLTLIRRAKGMLQHQDAESRGNRRDYEVQNERLALGQSTELLKGRPDVLINLGADESLWRIQILNSFDGSDLPFSDDSR